jgi:hypothetical protein
MTSTAGPGKLGGTPPGRRLDPELLEQGATLGVRQLQQRAVVQAQQVEHVAEDGHPAGEASHRGGVADVYALLQTAEAGPAPLVERPPSSPSSTSTRRWIGSGGACTFG